MITPTGTASMHRMTDQRRRQPRDHRIWSAQRNDRTMPDRRFRVRFSVPAATFCDGERAIWALWI
jgi:hypothetical protein